MSAPVKKCEVCDDTGSKSREIYGDLDCIFCTAATERAMLREKLRPMPYCEERQAWAAYQLGKAAAAPVVPAGHMPPEQGEMISASLALSPWLAAALDDPEVCSEYKTAISVWFNAAMPSATVDAFHARILDTNHILEDQLSKSHAPVVPVAAQPVVQAPTAWSYEWASFITTDGPQDFRLKFEAEPPPDWAVEDGQARNVVALYAAPSLEAQPAGEVIPAEKLCALLPGPYYMDPPDGGSVTVLEQVERMAKDAARYRFIRTIEKTACFWPFPMTTKDWKATPAEIDAEIDNAMAQGEKQ